VDIEPGFEHVKVSNIGLRAYCLGRRFKIVDNDTHEPRPPYRLFVTIEMPKGLADAYRRGELTIEPVSYYRGLHASRHLVGEAGGQR